MYLRREQRFGSTIAMTSAKVNALMMDVLLVTVMITIGLFLLLLFVQVRKLSGLSRAEIDWAPILSDLGAIQQGQVQVDRSVRDEISRNREEHSVHSHALRSEVVTVLTGIGDSVYPAPDDVSTFNRGAEHFQRHCQVCHGLDGHTTGVPFARNISPAVPDLGTTDIQKYTDSQLKWIIENGIRMSGMPGWKGLLEDDAMWQMVRYIRHLPLRGSLGTPEVFEREGEEHAQDHKAHDQK
jgi:mono/diheme cytochrome c family protein